MSHESTESIRKNGLPAPAATLQSLDFVYQSARSLMRNDPSRPGIIYRPIYEEHARLPELLPLNVEHEIFSDFVAIARQRQIGRNFSRRPYWDQSLDYKPGELLGATIQEFDLHDAPLPHSVLPPAADVSRFIDMITEAPYKAKVADQLKTALDITQDDLLGAINICWIATRFMARGSDQRAYPNIAMSEEALRQWSTKIAQFETYDSSEKNDGPGDAYYFWTHAFAAIALDQRSLQAKVGQAVFSKGTAIMLFVRENFSKGKLSNISSHEPASTIGRNIGLALTRMDDISL